MYCWLSEGSGHKVALYSRSSSQSSGLRGLGSRIWGLDTLVLASDGWQGSLPGKSFTNLLSSASSLLSSRKRLIWGCGRGGGSDRREQDGKIEARQKVKRKEGKVLRLEGRETAAKPEEVLTPTPPHTPTCSLASPSPEMGKSLRVQPTKPCPSSLSRMPPFLEVCLSQGPTAVPKKGKGIKLNKSGGGAEA